MKHVELEQFLHPFTSRGFDSVSWAFLYQYPGPVFGAGASGAVFHERQQHGVFTIMRVRLFNFGCVQSSFVHT